ncbi:MAG: tetratricopeptide repeat protein [Pseudolabrys sp.]
MSHSAIRLLATAALVAGAIGIDANAAARAATWCAQYQGGSSNCGFSTQAQCLATVSGAGGMCVPMGGNETQRARSRVKPEKAARRKPDKRTPEKKAAEPAPPKATPTPPAAVVTPQPPAAVTPASAARLSPAGRHNFQMARAFILSGKYEEAIAALKAVGNDEHPDVASALGYANAKLGRFEEARAWYAKALAADPDHLATLNYSGALHVQQAEMTEARRDLAHIETICRGTACREYRELQALIAAKQ